jgi:hypothetical protein
LVFIEGRRVRTVAQVGEGIKSPSAAAFDEGVDDGAAFSSLGMAEEEPIPSTPAPRYTDAGGGGSTLHGRNGVQAILFTQRGGAHGVFDEERRPSRRRSIARAVPTGLGGGWRRDATIPWASPWRGDDALVETRFLVFIGRGFR